MLDYKAFSTYPPLNKLYQKLQADLKFNCTQAIGTAYIEEDDNIGYHHDKMKDISLISPIVSASFGDAREFQFCEPGHEDAVPLHTVVLRHGDIFILGPRTNKLLKHRIATIAQERVIERPNGEFGPRVSIVLRDIKTKISRVALLKKLKIDDEDKITKEEFLQWLEAEKQAKKAKQQARKAADNGGKPTSRRKRNRS